MTEFTVMYGKGREPSAPPFQQAEPEADFDFNQGADKYHGSVAAGYDAKRESQPKWIDEQRIITDWLSDLPSGTKLIDVPFGTGRFIDFYRSKGFYVAGIDKSEDMLKIAQAKIGGHDERFHLICGNILNMSTAEDDAEVSLMIRLSRWLSPEEFKKALIFLQHATSKRIIFTARVRNHPYARTYEMINDALGGWRIYDDRPAGDENYRVIQLRPE